MQEVFLVMDTQRSQTLQEEQQPHFFFSYTSESSENLLQRDKHCAEINTKVEQFT